MTLNTLKNMDGAYLQLSPKNWSYIYNMENNLCLSPTVVDPLPCQNVKPKSFTFIDTWLATTTAGSTCYTMKKFQIQTIIKNLCARSAVSLPSSPLVYQSSLLAVKIWLRGRQFT